MLWDQKVSFLFREWDGQTDVWTEGFLAREEGKECLASPVRETTAWGKRGKETKKMSEEER